jgi:hypothetical protein
MRRLCAARVRKRPAQAHKDAAERARGAAAGDRARGARPPTAIRESDSVPELPRQPDRLPQFWPPLEARSGEGWDRAVAPSLRPASHLRHLRAPRRRFSVRGLALHGLEHAMIDRHYGHLARDSREHAVSLLDALAIERAVDAGWTSPATPPMPVTTRVSKPRRTPPRRSVDVRWTLRHEIADRAANRRA